MTGVDRARAGRSAIGTRRARAIQKRPSTVQRFGATRGWLVLRTLLTLLTAAGLGYDAYAHLDLAGTYDAVRTSALSQGSLFRAESAAAILAAVLLVVRPRRYTAVLAFAVAASGLGGVLLYRYVDVGRIGLIPSMYEPVWYPEKTHSAWAEAVATAAAGTLLGLLQFQRRRNGRRGADR